MKQFILTLLITPVLLISCLVTASRAEDVFDRHSSYWLTQAIEKGKPLESLAMQQALRTKPIAAGFGATIIVRTSEGNLTKALLGWGFRKGPDKPQPVLLIERFATYRAGRGDVTKANGKDILLFPGFAFDFDIGQVVPAKFGGDVLLDEKIVLHPAGKSQLYLLSGSQLPQAKKTDVPNPRDHKGVLPSDFTGTWLVDIDGQWKGEWILTAERTGQAHGIFLSTDTRSRYPIKGRIAALPHRIKLEIDTDNFHQSVDAFLWTKDKAQMTGIVTFSGREFGFRATRKVEKKPKPADKP